MINITSALDKASQQLKQDCRLEAELLLSHVLHQNRAYLFAHPETILDPPQYQFYQELIAQRVMGMPIAYLTGTKEFWSLSLKVNQHTLIPRPETEHLVELALELISKDTPKRILDLGTGSGAIALALAKERPHWELIACDVSPDALAVAQTNANHLGIPNVTFYQSSWFENIPLLKYDAIISNPPYIAEYDPHLLQGDLRFEPVSALASGQKGLNSIEYIIENSCRYLLPKGLLLLEHGYNQKNDVHAILNKIGYNNVQCWQDIQGHDRVSGGWHTHRTI